MRSILVLLLYPFSVLYGAATRIRLFLYSAGLFKSTRIDVPVISVGNITAGGTGKTPIVEWIARMLASHGRQVTILTRGYRRSDPNSRVVVSSGSEIHSSLQQSGDEALLLAEHLRGKASVICDGDRVSAARWAIDNLGSDVFVLDDGFQHVRIRRDLDIVLIDATEPWGGGHLIPAGRLRESEKGLRRANAIIITRSDLSPDIRNIHERVLRLSGGKPVFTSRTRITALNSLDCIETNQTTDGTGITSVPQPDPNLPAFVFCGIGNSKAFFDQLREAGHKIAGTRSFRDHHDFTQQDIDEVHKNANDLGARRLLTTEKDAIKLRQLRFNIECLVVTIEPEFDDQEKLVELIVSVL